MSFGSRSLKNPTAEELERWQQIKGMGICCVTHKRGPVEIHHLLSGGGLRLGHRYTVGLDPEVHRGVKVRDFKSRWPNQALLDKQDQLLCWGPKATIPARPERKRKSQCTASAKQVRREGLPEKEGSIPTPHSLPPSRRRKRGSQCTASSKTPPRRL